MRPGDLTERFRFDKRRDTSPDGDRFGTFEGDWEVKFTVSANIKYRHGGEQVLAARLAGTKLAVLTIRASHQSKEITSEWRCVDARTGDAFNIKEDPTLTDDRQWLEMLVERGVNSG